MQRQPSEAPFCRDCRSTSEDSEEPILQERRRLEIRIGGRSVVGRTDRGEREDSNYEFMAAEGARGSLATPSFGGARERREKEGEKQIYRKRE